MINFDTSNFGAAEFEGMAKVVAAFASLDPDYRETIGEGSCGFNQYSGYVYMALDCGVTIGSMLGRNVLYMVNDYDDCEEYFFRSFEGALRKLLELNS